MVSNVSPQPLRLAHHIDLSRAEGVVPHFAAFAARAARHHAARQSVVVGSPTIHKRHRRYLRNFDDWRYEDRWFGLQLGARAAPLRRLRYRWLARRLDPEVALLWDRLDQRHPVLDALGEQRCLYWEHGSAWWAGDDACCAEVLARMPAVICNSQAARRVLELRWGYSGVTRVCPDGMRSPYAAREFKRLALGRPLHIGVAGPLVPAAGTCLALHALAELRAQGHRATLSVAGDGSLRDALVQLAERLGIAPYVDFIGTVDDPSLFFAEIDLLLHPVLSEPFGSAAAEAGAMGCPVVCTAVDGLPEVVADGRTGLCVSPTADLARYRSLDGSLDYLPATVYLPFEDRIAEPGVCEPQALAAAVVEITDRAERFSEMSHEAIDRMRACFDFDAHVDDVMRTAAEFHDTGTLEPRS